MFAVPLQDRRAVRTPILLTTELGQESSPHAIRHRS
jgi:hypothetical protein